MRSMQFAAAQVPGGLVSHVRLLCVGLRARGHSVTAVLSPSPALDRHARECEAAGAKVVRLAVRGKGDVAGIVALRRLVAREEPEVFHAHLASPIESAPSLLAARWGGA